MEGQRRNIKHWEHESDNLDKDIFNQRRVNYGLNDANLNLLRQIEELERHIRLTVEQNKLIGKEIDNFISADKLVTRTLESRSPQKNREPGHMSFAEFRES